MVVALVIIFQEPAVRNCGQKQSIFCLFVDPPGDSKTGLFGENPRPTEEIRAAINDQAPRTVILAPKANV